MIWMSSAGWSPTGWFHHRTDGSSTSNDHWLFYTVLLCRIQLRWTEAAEHVLKSAAVCSLFLYDYFLSFKPSSDPHQEAQTRSEQTAFGLTGHFTFCKLTWVLHLQTLDSEIFLPLQSDMKSSFGWPFIFEFFWITQDLLSDKRDIE